MVQVELRNVYINIGANSGSEKLLTKRKTLSLPVSKLKQYMFRTFMYIFFVQVSQDG